FLRDFPAESDPRGTALSPDGRWLAAAGGVPGPIQLFDLESGQGPRLLEGHAQPISRLAFRPDGTHLATAGWDGTLKVWEVSTGRELLGFRAHDGGIQALAWSADGTRLATAINGRKDRQGEIRGWEAQTGGQLLMFRHEMQLITGMAFHPDGRQLVTAGGVETRERVHGNDKEDSQSGQLQVWDLARGREPRDLPGHTDLVMSLVFS